MEPMNQEKTKQTEKMELLTVPGNAETVVTPETRMEDLRRKYKENGEKIYELRAAINEDDDTETEYTFLFRRPTTASYDRYVKMSSSSPTKALRTFLTDNICQEQETQLRDLLEDFPALSISLGEKMLAMLGFAKDVAVKKL